MKEVSVIRTLRSRAAAIAAVFMFILVLICSSVFIAEHTVHECTGDDCAVCMELSQCMNIIRTLGTSLPVIMAAAALMTVILFPVKRAAGTLVSTTLISLKVELLN